MKKLITEIIKFSMVGVVGFLVDAALVLMLHEHFGAYIARIVSFSCAVITTWVLNRTLTFKNTDKSHGIISEFTKYFLSMCIGGSVNLLCYSAIVSLKENNSENILFATAIGSIAGLFFNFSLTKVFIYKEK